MLCSEGAVGSGRAGIHPCAPGKALGVSQAPLEKPGAVLPSAEPLRSARRKGQMLLWWPAAKSSSLSEQARSDCMRTSSFRSLSTRAGGFHTLSTREEPVTFLFSQCAGNPLYKIDLDNCSLASTLHSDIPLLNALGLKHDTSLLCPNDMELSSSTVACSSLIRGEILEDLLLQLPSHQTSNPNFIFE